MATVRAGQPEGSAIRPVVAVPPSGRRRRPSGEPPPLPRRVQPSTQVYAAAAAATVVLEVAIALRPVRAAVTAVDVAVVRGLEQVRPAWWTDVLEVVALLGSAWPIRVLFWGTLAVLVVTRRVHHLAAYLMVLVHTSLAAVVLVVGQGRMRPPGVEIAGAWEGYAHPSLPVALLSLAAVGVLRTLLPAGRWRQRGTAVAVTAVGALAVARVWLGVDAPSDVVAALGLGWALPAAVLGLALPDDSFPVRYRTGTRAHVGVDGARGTAIVQALEDQLGLRATALEPFGLGGSAGSMPMRVRLERGSLFAKLYTVTHLRSDRRYKLARMVLYGRLEDEKPFSSVRRLVEYEDHMLRLLRDAGLPVPAPHGLVEITPEREYVVVMELFEGAVEVSEVTLTDAEIDDGLRIVRQLWEAGVAHRDIKPSNLLVRDGRVLLIDVAFATVRPTPWRQAVDLANMMLTLALSSSAERVYDRALLQFAPDDVAEAFAAGRSVTVPTQLRAHLKADGRDLGGRFRELAPHRDAVPIQLWTARRVLLTFGVLSGVLVTLIALASYARVVNLL